MEANFNNNHLTTFYFDKKRIILIIATLLVFSAGAVWFIKDSEMFMKVFLIKAFFKKKEYFQLFGYVSLLSGLVMIYAYIMLLFRKKEALIIAGDYLIDNSKFESVGKIHYNEIKKIKKFKKYNVELVLKDEVLNLKKLNFLQKVVFWLNHWYSQRFSVFITCAHIRHCNRDQLYNILTESYQKWKSRRLNKKFK